MTEGVLHENPGGGSAIVEAQVAVYPMPVMARTFG